MILPFFYEVPMSSSIETTIIGTLDPRRASTNLVIDIIEDFFTPQLSVMQKEAEEKVSLKKDFKEALSTNCSCQNMPEGCFEEQGSWHALRIKRKCHIPSSVSLSRLLQPLSVCGLDVLMASNQDADFVMVKNSDLERAIDILRIAGHRVQTLKQKENTTYSYTRTEAQEKNTLEEVSENKINSSLNKVLKRRPNLKDMKQALRLH